MAYAITQPLTHPYDNQVASSNASGLHVRFGRLVRVLEMRVVVVSGADNGSCGAVFLSGCEAESECRSRICTTINILK